MNTNCLTTNQPQKRGSARRQPEPPNKNMKPQPQIDETDPRRVAEKLIAKIEAANEARKIAIESAAANAERLKQLDLEIESLERKVSLEDFPALTELAARRDQRVRLAQKFSADAAAATRAADAAGDAVTDSEVSDFFWQVKSTIKLQIVKAVLPFVSDAGKAERIAENCDSTMLLNRHANALGSAPREQKLQGLLPVLREFLAGRAPWLFTENNN